MRTYALAIFKDHDNPTYGVVVPDVPGCYPSGDSIEEAITDSKALIKMHISFILDENLPFDFKTRSIEELRLDPEYQDALTWAIVEIDETALSDKQTRFNVSWPEYLLARVDEYTNSHHETRSGFLAKAAIAMMENERTKAVI